MNNGVEILQQKWPEVNFTNNKEIQNYQSDKLFTRAAACKKLTEW